MSRNSRIASTALISIVALGALSITFPLGGDNDMQVQSQAAQTSEQDAYTVTTDDPLAPHQLGIPKTTLILNTPPASNVDSANPVQFGMLLPDRPTSDTYGKQVNAVAASLNTKMSLLSYFEASGKLLDVRAVNAVLNLGATPLISLETQTKQGTGTSINADSSTWAPWNLKDIASGKYDQEIRINVADQLAKVNAGRGGTVLIRLDHEMNGIWYCWSEGIEGNYQQCNQSNTSGDYVKAWQHFVDVVRAEGTGKTVVKWVWSPNILRGASGDRMIAAFPGTNYVDYMGLTAYGSVTYEKDVASTLDKTVNLLRKRLPHLPLIITETAAAGGKYRDSWTLSWGNYLKAHPYVVGFVWYNTTPSDGAGDYYEITDAPTTMRALAGALNTAGASKP